MTKFTDPAVSPFRQAMTIASLVETLRVRLLSIAQHAHAAATSRAPSGTLVAPGRHDNATPPATIASMPRNTWVSTFSRNTIHAISAVKTPSRFSSNELVAGGAGGLPATH